MSRHPHIGALLVALSCGCKDPPAPTPTPATEPGPSLEIAVDGNARRVALDGPTPLSALVSALPPTWLDVRGETADRRVLELTRPTSTYPDGEVRLYLDQGRPALGVFTRVTADMPPDVAALARQPIAFLAGVTRVDVDTRPARAIPPVVVEVAGAPVTVSGDQLRTLAAAGAPAHGWKLVDVIALATSTRPARARIVGDGEVTVDLGDGSQILALKANQRGEHVMRVWEVGGRHPTREVRRVTKIVVE